MSDIDWSNAAARLIRTEAAREGVTLGELAARLQGLGLQETEASVRNKLSRGTFSAAFLLQAMVALGQQAIDVSSVLPSDVAWGAAAEASTEGGR